MSPIWIIGRNDDIGKKKERYINKLGEVSKKKEESKKGELKLLAINPLINYINNIKRIDI